MQGFENIEFTGKAYEGGSGLIPVGVHAVTLKNVRFDLDPVGKSDAWTDESHQIGFVFEDEKGRILTYYANTAGYKRFKDLTEAEKVSGQFVSAGTAGYVVDVQTGQRVKDDARTKTCIDIIQGIVHACGYDKAKLSELPGAKLGIEVIANDYDTRPDAPGRVDKMFPIGELELATEPTLV